MTNYAREVVSLLWCIIILCKCGVAGKKPSSLSHVTIPSKWVIPIIAMHRVSAFHAGDQGSLAIPSVRYVGVKSDGGRWVIERHRDTCEGV